MSLVLFRGKKRSIILEFLRFRIGGEEEEGGGGKRIFIKIPAENQLKFCNLTAPLLSPGNKCAFYTCASFIIERLS